MAEQFEQSGYRLMPFGEPVDICVINTCTVTGKSDYHCRQMIRKAKKISPSAKIAVVGCYAQLNSDKIQGINGVDFILGSDKKFDLLDILTEKKSKDQVLFLPSSNNTFLRPCAGSFWDHTRAFLKIQDGCDSFCSYCTVPLARGRSRSESLDQIILAAKQLVQRGHREIVLTGVHIGRYGKDLNPARRLLDVLIELEQIPDLNRIRLSSMELSEIDEALLDWIINSRKVCHHFHIPLQSGDDEILKGMNRNYTSRIYFEVIQRLKKMLPDCGLGTDVIVGFPGETEERFQNTYRLIEQLPFTYLHVFSYSPRKGTSAARLSDQVKIEDIKRRSQILRSLGKKKKIDFYRSLIGQKIKVLWEEKNAADWMFGFSGNYARVGAKANPEFFNKICDIEIVAAEPNFVHGTIRQA